MPGMSGTVIPNGGGGGMGLVVNIIEAPGKGGETQQRQENGQNVLDIFVEKVGAPSPATSPAATARCRPR